MIVTYDGYLNCYGGVPVTAAEFQRMAARAERAVAQMTHGRAAEDKLPALPPALQTAVRTAIYAQIEYYTIIGSSVAVTGNTGAGGWTVGKVHVNGSGAASGRTAGASLICPGAIAALEQTGLLNPAVDVVDAPGPVLPGGWYGC